MDWAAQHHGSEQTGEREEGHDARREDSTGERTKQNHGPSVCNTFLRFPCVLELRFFLTRDWDGWGAAGRGKSEMNCDVFRLCLSMLVVTGVCV